MSVITRSLESCQLTAGWIESYTCRLFQEDLFEYEEAFLD
jgi:hypothetical protein